MYPTSINITEKQAQNICAPNVHGSTWHAHLYKHIQKLLHPSSSSSKQKGKREWCILRTLEMHDQHKMPTRKTLKLQGIITRDKIQEQKA